MSLGVILPDETVTMEMHLTHNAAVRNEEMTLVLMAKGRQNLDIQC